MELKNKTIFFSSYYFFPPDLRPRKQTMASRTWSPPKRIYTSYALSRIRPEAWKYCAPLI